jgi:hypothetical protein
MWRPGAEVNASRERYCGCCWEAQLYHLATHYHRSKRNGSTTQRSSETPPKAWNLVSLSHGIDKFLSLTPTLLPSAPLSSPRRRGSHPLHHGFPSCSRLAEQDAVHPWEFERVPFKILPIDHLPLSLTPNESVANRSVPPLPEPFRNVHGQSAGSFATSRKQQHPSRAPKSFLHFSRLSWLIPMDPHLPLQRISRSVSSARCLILRFPDGNDESS